MRERLKSRIMYLENKSAGLAGPARIGRVRFSKTGRMLYYRGLDFQALKGSGFKANYFETASGDLYWISGCKRDGLDRLYAGVIEIDEDARKEYWTEVRCLPNVWANWSSRLQESIECCEERGDLSG